MEDVSTGDSKMDDAKRKREEKKQQRQKELEARRANRTGAGSMKLGAKKAWRKWPLTILTPTAFFLLDFIVDNKLTR